MDALLLSHNADEGAVLRLALQRLGFVTRIETEIHTIGQTWHQQRCDLYILTFPRREIPINFIKQLRAYIETPIVLITEPVIEEVQVALWDTGIDLLIFRPYSVRVLMAQIRSLLRRGAERAIISLPVLRCGEINLNPEERTVQVGALPARRLTQLEFRLLYVLLNHAGQVLSAEQLVEMVWGYSGRGDRDMVRGLVKRLRAKVEPDPKHPRFILTVPGAGYKLEA